MRSSKLSGFYKLSPEERRKIVADFVGLNEEEIALLQNTGALSEELWNRMVENAIGVFQVPLGIATNFLINKKEYLIPMVIEEPSVIAGASYAAKLARERGGFIASSTDPIMIGQVQVVDVKDAEEGLAKLREKKEVLLKALSDVSISRYGGGVRDLEAKRIKTFRGDMLIVNFFIDVRDAMGANIVNTIMEEIAPSIQEIVGGKIRLRIVSNLSSKRLARAEAVFGKEVIGEEIIEGILDAYAFACADIYRCATHNKGIMNGVVAVGLATGNDTRAIEAGAHSFASLSGVYSPLTKWEKDENGDLRGKIELPLSVGIVGGAIKTHPIAKIGIKLLGVKTSRELSEVMAAVGLAQNFAALRALVAEGIQKGHMKLHAKNIAIQAGAKGKLIDEIAERMVKEGKISLSRAKELLKEENL